MIFKGLFFMLGVDWSRIRWVLVAGAAVPISLSRLYSSIALSSLARATYYWREWNEKVPIRHTTHCHYKFLINTATGRSNPWQALINPPHRCDPGNVSVGRAARHSSIPPPYPALRRSCTLKTLRREWPHCITKLFICS